MMGKIYIKDLYEDSATTRGFDLGKLPHEGLAEEMAKFIKARSKQIKASSIKGEIYPYNQLCKILCEYFSERQSFTSIDICELEQKSKVYLLKNGKNISTSRMRADNGKEKRMEPEVIYYARKVIGFFEDKKKGFDIEDDIWQLEDLPFCIKTNPTKNTKSINFSKIPQEEMRKEIKECILQRMLTRKFGTVLADMTAVNRFSSFCLERLPHIQSFNDLVIEDIEEYIEYLELEDNRRKSYSKELYHLKSIFKVASEVLENEYIGVLLPDELISKEPGVLYRSFSENELIKWRKAISTLDIQIQRLMALHELLGTRISDTLTIKQKDVYIDERGQWHIQINQVKTDEPYEIAITDEIKKVVDAACNFTNQKYGECEYIFVRNEYPKEPMQYSRIQYQLMVMIQRENLRDDQGDLFGVRTHWFRHLFGMRLVDLGYDDEMIAKLMGQKSTSSLKAYRRQSPKTLAIETKALRDKQEEMMRNYL